MMRKTKQMRVDADSAPAKIFFGERKGNFNLLDRVDRESRRAGMPLTSWDNELLFNKRRRSIIGRYCLTRSVLLTGALYGISDVVVAQTEQGLSGNLRVGFIHAENVSGEETDGSAVGGKLGYVSPTWKGLSAGMTFYTTGELFDDEIGDFFSSEHDSYSILGEAYIQGVYHNSILHLGRFGLDTPHADSDDIRMVPNTFQGILLSNSDIGGTTLYLTHLDKWAGWDADIPERFQEINGDNGLTALGAVYEGVAQLTVQGWYYQGSDLAKLFYLEAVYEGDSFNIGMQFGSQSDDTNDDSGPDGDVWGITGSYILSDLTLTAAFNDVTGTVINGFGGGPYFTSADDHTIDGTEDQQAAAFGIEYGGTDALTLGVFHVDFDQGENETDYYAIYDVNGQLDLELIYVDMHEDGDYVLLMANYGF